MIYPPLKRDRLGSINPWSPLSTLHDHPREGSRMTRGWGGWLGPSPCATFTRYPCRGAIRSPIRTFNSSDSGNQDFSWRDQMVSPSTRTSNIAPLPGTKATSPNSLSNVVKSSCAIYPAPGRQPQCQQNSISSRDERVMVLYLQKPCSPRKGGGGFWR